MNRPHINQYFIAIAQIVATRGTCVRRKVGCVLTDENNFVLSTGYNGRPKGQPHCHDQPCSGAGAKSGDDLDKCEAIHAEANALLQCKDVQEIRACYVTAFPCIHCLKLLMNTGCNTIYYADHYIDRKATYDLNDIWKHSGGTMVRQSWYIGDIKTIMYKTTDGGIWKPFQEWKPYE